MAYFSSKTVSPIVNALLLILVAIWIFACGQGACQSAAPKGKLPNVVFILVDDLGYGDLGCYGAKDIRTPNLDALAQAGVRFTDAYASAPVCSPTRAALMTGRYPQRSGFEWVIRYGEKDVGLKPTKTSLPRMMKDAGYRTALFGKWHLGSKPEFAPNAHGFDEFFGFHGADLDYYSHDDALGEPDLFENRDRIQEKGYLTDLITDRALKFIDNNARNPFFLEVAYNAPHWPFQRPNHPEDVRDKNTYGPRNGTRADYIEMVEYLDGSIGKLLKSLENRDLTRDTLVLFCSDNGGERLSNNSPLFHGKYTLWEGGIRVPCIARWPSVLTEKTVSKLPITTLDIAASILAAGKVDPPTDPPLDGQDIVPILLGKKPAEERNFFWRLARPDEQFGQYAVRRGKWKLIRDREIELLFDLENDPSERKNLAYEYPEIVAQLRKALMDWDRQLPPAVLKK